MSELTCLMEPVAKLLAYRLTHCMPVVDTFFEWCLDQRQLLDLLPRDLLARALGDVRRREHELRVFLEKQGSVSI